MVAHPRWLLVRGVLREDGSLAGLNIKESDLIRL